MNKHQTTDKTSKKLSVFIIFFSTPFRSRWLKVMITIPWAQLIVIGYENPLKTSRQKIYYIPKLLLYFKRWKWVVVKNLIHWKKNYWFFYGYLNLYVSQNVGQRNMYPQDWTMYCTTISGKFKFSIGFPIQQIFYQCSWWQSDG